MEFAGRFVAFHVLFATAAHSGWRLAGAMLRAAPLAERALGAAVAAAGIVSLLLLAAGSSGALSLAVVLPAQVATWAAVVWLTRTRYAPADLSPLADALTTRPGFRVVGAGVYLALAVLAALAWQGLVRPDYDYDTLTNHLFVPARWIQSGQVGLVETPFGAPTAAYEPMATELFYAWLMLPFHSDLLARFGQLGHLAVVYLALYAIARRAGLGRTAAAVGPLALHLVKPILAEAGGAMTDLAFAAWWMASLALALGWRERRDAGSASALVLALGLCLGTKFVAVALFPLLIAGVLALRFAAPPELASRPARLPFGVLASSGLTATLAGGYWYVRNWIAAGNPLFPVRVELGRWEIFPGAFGAAQLEAWVFNRRVSGLTARHVLEQLGESLGRGPAGSWYAWPAIPIVVFVTACVIATYRGDIVRRVPALVLLGLAAAVFAIAWLVLPSHAPRFVFTSLATWALAPAIVAATGRLGAVVVGFGLAAHVLISREHYFDPAFTAWWWVLVSVPLVAVVAAALRRMPARFPNRRPLLSAAVAVFVVVSFAPLRVGYERSRARELRAWGALGEAWAWVDRRIEGSRIAYAGHNLPYFLLGSRLDNEAFYVNAEARGGSYHDYFRRFAADYAEPYTPEPAYYRMEEDEAAWLVNLEAADAQYLFVAALPWNERVNHRHSREGFVVEDAWASAHPESFELLFANTAARVFAIREVGRARPASPPTRRVEVDAVELYVKDPLSLERFYPGARAFIEQNRVAVYARER